MNTNPSKKGATKSFSLYDYQIEAADQLKTGSVLNGGVGSGKTITSIYYYYTKVCGGSFLNAASSTKMTRQKPLYVITTAKKRDSLDWVRELAIFGISKDLYVIDSWNNIKKYVEISDSFFIFDEQRVIGSGAWVNSFLKIVKKNDWILLTATPGDGWMDYIPVFVANGFYKNRTDFIRQHVVFKSFMKYPVVDRFININKLKRLKEEILVSMEYLRPTEIIDEYLYAEYEKEEVFKAVHSRWNPFKNRPIKNESELFFVVRRIINSDPSRLSFLLDLIRKHKKIIVFYNFNYELYILRRLPEFEEGLLCAEYNGHKHDPIPETEKWVYLVQYISGSEGWNCIETNALVFYSQNYSYRLTKQARGRIDRLNTPFTKLYYYTLISNSSIDKSISRALKNKKNFNRKHFKFALKSKHIIEGE